MPIQLRRRGNSALALQIEQRLDRGFLLVDADQLRRGARAEQHRERAHDDRLARAGLAREHVEAGAELERRLLDNREVADAQFEQHRGCYPQRSLSRQISKYGWVERISATTLPALADLDRVVGAERDPLLPVERERRRELGR